MARLDIQRTHDGSVEHLQLRPGENRVLVRPGQQFRLNRADVDPEQLRVLKVDSDLVIEGIPATAAGSAAASAEGIGEGAASEASSIVLEGYYRICSASDRCTVSVDDGTASAEAVASGELGSTGQVLADVSTQPLGALPDGNFVLYDPSFEAPILPMLGDGSAKPLLYGLGGAAVLGLALGGGGGGGGDSGLPPQGNISLTLKSGAYFNTRFPTISGTAQPGSEVQLRIDTDGDQRANVTYTTTSDTSGNWAVNLQTAKPSAGELPATGLADSNTMEVVGMHNGVQSILPQTTMTFDNTPPAEAEISPIADDNIITGGERDKGVTFSGTSEANGSVELKVGTLAPRLVAVDADGKWSATLGKADLPEADGDYTVSVTSLDAAGNRGPEATTKITMNTSGKQAIIGQIAGTDDTVNATEASQPIKIAGVAEAGAKLKLSIIDSNKQVTELPGEATADANGAWSADITLPATLTDGQYTLSVTSTNALGNTATGTRAFTVDKTAPNPVANLKVEGGDTIITSQEAKSGVDITGTAEAGAKVTVTVAGGKTQTATAGANGAWKVTLHDTDLPALGKGQTLPGKLTITAEDKAGNISQPVEQALTLEGAPVDARTPTINKPGALDDGWLNAEEAKIPMKLTGTASAGDTVKLSIGGIALADVKAQANGAWEAAVPPSVLGGIADGPNKEITASAVTAQGGTSTGASKVIFSVDKTPPGQPSNIKANGNDLDINAQEAQSGKAQFSGDAPGGATKVTVNWNGQTHDAQVNNGKWTTEFDSLPPVAAGGTAPAKVTVVAYDAANNKSVTAEQTITVHSSVSQAKQPTIDPVSGGQVDANEAKAPVTISGTAEPNATVTISVAGQANKTATATAGPNGKWTTTMSFADVPDGPVTLNATAKLGNGQASPVGSGTFTLDKTVPTITDLKSSDGNDISAQAAADGVTFTGKTEANAKVSATWEGVTHTTTASKTDGSWSITFAANQVPKVGNGQEKDTKLAVHAEDGVNIGADVTMDLKVRGTPAASNAPKINGPISGDGLVSEKEDDTVEISGTAQPGASVEVSVVGANNVKQSATAATGTGSWKVTLDMSGVSEGAHSVNAVATLPGGTASPAATASFTIDRVVTKPSNITYDGHTSNIITNEERKDDVALTGKAEPNSTLDITVGGKTQTGIKAGPDGSWQSGKFELQEAPTGGESKTGISFYVKDGAGNGPTNFSGDDIIIKGPTAQASTPTPPAPNPAITPAGPRSTTASSLTTDDEGSVANGPDDTETAAAGTSASGAVSAGTAGAGSTTSAGAAATTSPATGSSADNAADATVPGAAGTTSATPGTAADAPASTGPTVAGKSLSGSGTTAHAGNHGSSKLSLSDLLEQGGHDMPELQGAPSAGQSVVSTAAASSSAAVTSTTAGAGETGSTIVSNPVATVNTLLASQQPWEHQPTV